MHIDRTKAEQINKVYLRQERYKITLQIPTIKIIR